MSKRKAKFRVNKEADAMENDKLSEGTFKCDICGLDRPHPHTDEEVELQRFVRPAFEKTRVPCSAFARYGLGVTMPYRDGRTEALWQHFVSGWFGAKEHIKSISINREKGD